MGQDGFFDNDTTLKTAEIALDEVFEAYYECRRCKRRTVNALVFELDFEREIIQLWRDINSGRYRMKRSIAFIVKEPVQREIFAADFRDRVVHHLVIGKLSSIFEQNFIDDSYSCRRNRGMLYGVRRISDMIKKCSAGYRQNCYILKLDIRSFFMSMDKFVLYRLVTEQVEKGYHQADKPVVLQLIKQIIFHCPENNCIIKGCLSDWNGLPCHKSLFWSEKGRGLPIGNLTSQIFANCYLNKLDKFVVDELKLKYYGRYVDDFVLIHQSRDVLCAAKRKIEKFLKEELKLTLHPQKVYLQHYGKGVRFIGAVIKPGRIYIGNRTKKNLYRKIYMMLPQMGRSVESVLSGIEHFSGSINSYLGLMRHYNTYHLRRHILDKLNQTFLAPILKVDSMSGKLLVDKLFRPVEQKKRQLRHQRQYRRYCMAGQRGDKNGFI